MRTETKSLKPPEAVGTANKPDQPVDSDHPFAHRDVADEIDFCNGQANVEIYIELRSTQEGPHLHLFHASSFAMGNACAYWRKLLRENAQEGQPTVLDFTTKSYQAIKILLSIVHSRFGSIPLSLEPFTLLEIAKATDEYDATALVAPWIKAWVKWGFQKSGAETCQAHRLLSSEERLIIAWAFGMSEEFAIALQEIVMGSFLIEFPPQGMRRVRLLGPNGSPIAQVLHNKIGLHSKPIFATYKPLTSRP
jgi:hypothetical protein